MNTIKVPSRKELLCKLQAANRHAWLAITIEGAAIALLVVTVIDWKHVTNAPLISTLVLFIMAGPGFFGLLRVAFQNAKPLQNLRDEVAFGHFRKRELINLVETVERKMGIPKGKVRAYITREKTVNASAIQVGLGRIFPALNAIYLNRSTIHYLSPEELSGVVAHEIAHNEWHYLTWNRFYLLHLCFGAAAGLALRQLFSPGSAYEILVPVGFAASLEWLLNRSTDRYSQILEYLCDDAGAVTSGLPAAVSGELKVASHSEAHGKALYYVLEKKLNGLVVSAKHAFEAVEESMPFGEIEEKLLKAAVDAKLGAAAAPKGSLSLKGFINFLSVTESLESREALQTEIDKQKMVEKIPKIEIPPLSGRALSIQQISELIEQIRANPDKVLFHIDSELVELATTHPGVRRRILYLWENRKEIDRDYSSGAVSRESLYRSAES